MPRIFDMTSKPPSDDLPVIATGRRALTMQRLQIGITGIGLMILLVALASIVRDRADTSDQTTVPGAAAGVEPTASAQQADPLVEAGVVPGMSGEQDGSPSGGASPVE